jgi:hypothetical protein
MNQSPDPSRIEKIVEKSGRFLSAEKRPSKHHDSPSIHHNFTTKTPQIKRPFQPNPL